MDLKLDEQRLITDFRRLSPAGKDELQEFVGSLLNKQRDLQEQETAPSGQCKLDKAEARPEAVKEPVFTE